MTLEYTIELDHSVWIPVPLAFPWNGYEDVASWSQDVSTALTTGAHRRTSVPKAMAPAPRKAPMLKPTLSAE